MLQFRILDYALIEVSEAAGLPAGMSTWKYCQFLDLSFKNCLLYWFVAYIFADVVIMSDVKNV